MVIIEKLYTKTKQTFVSLIVLHHNKTSILLNNYNIKWHLWVKNYVKSSFIVQIL